MKIARKSERTARGASIIIVALCALALVVLVYMSFQLMMIMGGSREVRNAVDSAILNTSKCVVGVKVGPDIFTDCADSRHQVGMSNISRVWGKALLINGNYQEMMNTGQGSGEASGNADQAYAAAQQVNDNLRLALTNKNTLDNFFNQFAAAKSAKMLGSDAVVTTAADESKSQWTTAMVDRGGESNLTFSPVQIPQGVNVKQVGGNFAGYTPFEVNRKPFVFPAFHRGEMPHLISDTLFNVNRSDVAPLPTNPIPNAFKEVASASGQGTQLSASASAEANPQRQYALAIPQGYVSIIFSNMSRWYVEKKKVFEAPYPPEPTPGYWGAKRIKLSDQVGGGLLDGYADLGDEYKSANLYLLYTKAGGDHSTPLKKLVQRMQEVDPNFSMTQLVQMMQSQVVKPGVSQYFIYPEYTTPDWTNPRIKIGADGGNLPGWLVQAAKSEGQTKTIVTEDTVKDMAKTWDNVMGGKNPFQPHYMEFKGTIDWVPGTGFTQRLGELRLARRTDCYYASEN